MTNLLNTHQSDWHPRADLRVGDNYVILTEREAQALLADIQEGGQRPEDFDRAVAMLDNQLAWIRERPNYQPPE